VMAAEKSVAQFITFFTILLILLQLDQFKTMKAIWCNRIEYDIVPIDIDL